MKTLAFLFFLFLVAPSFGKPSFSNTLDDLVKKALEVVRKHMKAQDPLPFPPLPPVVIDDDVTKVYLNVAVSGVTVGKASSFVVDKIDNNMVTLLCQYGLTLPQIEVAGNFQANGSAMGHKISGQGTFKASVTNLVTSGQAQLQTLDDGTLQEISHKLSYSIEDVKFSEQGLIVEGMTDADLKNFFDTKLLPYLQQNEPKISDRIASQALLNENMFLKGKTLDDIIELLQEFIDDGDF